MTGLTPKQLKTYNRLHYLKNRDRILKRAKLNYKKNKDYNSKKKLRKDHIDAVSNYYKKGLSQAEIGERFNVPSQMISKIINNI